MKHEEENQILFLSPVFMHNIWGGSRIRNEFGYQVSGDDIGECWGISAHPNGDAKVVGGIFDGMNLSSIWESNPELFGNLNYEYFPLLVKIIDAKEDLSIQVHPDDLYARKYENGSFGKTECWYILDCPENASLVIGHNAKTKEELSDMIHQEKWEEFIREVPVKKGDFIQIDPGTVHAIKGGLLILETQQNSDITYRIYDYNRLSAGKPRELHIDKSMDVITVPSKEYIKSVEGLKKNKLYEIYSCNYYTIFKMNVDGETQFEQKYPFLNVTIIEGEGLFNNKPIKKGDWIILTSHLDKVNLKGKFEMILSTV